MARAFEPLATFWIVFGIALAMVPVVMQIAGRM